MKLTSYLSARGLSLGAFARQLGVKNARTVQRWTKHGRVPSGKMMVLIARETAGHVQPNDFFSDSAE